MLSDIAEFVVQGLTVEGEIFEPADWAERLRDSLPKMAADGVADYSKYVRPEVIEGEVSLVVRIALKNVYPEAFAIIKRYISDSGLMVRAGRGSRDSEGTGKYPAFNKDRRDPRRNKW